MRISRHNGRSGKHGAYNPKHNDREFNLENSSHIDPARALDNVYWDYERGYRNPRTDKPDGISFEQIELKFYEDNFGEFVKNQNARNDANRHSERNRTVEDLYRSEKTCPEETIYQIGNKDKFVDGTVLKKIVNKLLDELEERFGSHMYILDMALHLDEATPHIHERHIFYSPNKHGEWCPQQEKALKEMGVPLPDPKKPQGQYNNRKMSFDAECRRIFIRICKSHGLDIEEEAIYGGQEYLEKNDYIMKKQKETIDSHTHKIQTQEKRIEVLDEKLGESDKLVEDLCDAFYEVALPSIAQEMISAVSGEQKGAIYSLDRDYIDCHPTATSEQRRFGYGLLNKVIESIDLTVAKVVETVKWRNRDQWSLFQKGKIQDKLWEKIEKQAKEADAQGKEDTLAQTMIYRRRGGR